MHQFTLDQLDPPIILEPREQAEASVVWLHGLGADGHDFEPIVAELSDDLRDRVRFVFPHAPQIPVTVNGGTSMRAWYDIADAQFDKRADETGVRNSGEILASLLDRETKSGIEPHRLVAAGFSQGGAIALFAGLRYWHKLAGIMALSTYLPLGEQLASERHASNAETPIFLAHGSQDPMVPISFSEQSRLRLRELGYTVETHTYPMAHSVCSEELRDLDDWLTRVLLD